MPDITDVASLMKAIGTLQDRHKDAEFLFRGEPEVYEKLLPSIFRDGYIDNEDILFREYILRNPDDFRNERSTFEKLVKMQHYGLPTRLLDITANPLIALFFATEKLENKDGQLFVFAAKRGSIKYYDSDTVSVVANVSRRPVDRLDISKIHQEPGEPDEKFRDRFNREPSIQYLLHEIKDEKPYFKDHIVKSHLESVVCVKPLLNNRRIVRQDGAFLLFGTKGDKSQPAELGPDIRKEKLTVKNKKHLKDELRLLGITRDKVYPELDGTAEYLKEAYKK